MSQACSKCGAETDYNNDLHCRSIFIEEIEKLLSLGELEKAKDLYFSASFDNEWKENFLSRKGRQLQKVILEEQRVKEDRGRESLNIKKVRTPHCYACKALLSNLSKVECSKCGWIICSCGACGCGYDGQDFDNEDIL